MRELVLAVVLAVVPIVTQDEPTESPSPEVEVEIGEAVQARVRVVARTCSRVVTVVEEREGEGPWKVIDRRVEQRDACPEPAPPAPVPTVIASGM